MTTDPRYYEIVEATWPAAALKQAGPVTLRQGQGGGSRVSAATVDGAASEAQIDAAEAAMRDMGQDCLFMIRDGEDALDAQLAARGYVVMDPVNLWTCPVERLTDVPIPRVTTFCLWEPLQIQLEIWEAGGIGPDRVAVMERARGPKTAILGRFDDKPGGAAFVGIHDGTAMLHALEVPPHQRRKGMAGWMVRQAAFWAAENGATELAVLCTKRNEGANGLYASLGLDCTGQYHYRHLPQGD